jgi:3'(2'), 5'-bisphosphate nucleotidase
MELGSAELSGLLDAARAIAAQAGQEIMQIYADGYDIDHKDDRTPITSADLAAHRSIAEGLSQLPLDLPLLSEESDPAVFELRRDWPLYWLVDPLDGTREFIRHSGEFTVNIALVQGDRPILGVVAAPALGHTYYAARGLGAFKTEQGSVPKRIRVRALGARRPVVAASHSHRSDQLSEFLERIGPHRLISMGSALKSCLVAEGRADLYVRLGPTSEWDTAAPQCVVEEAGGQYTDTHMRAMRYNQRETLLNPPFFVFGNRSRDWSTLL